MNRFEVLVVYGEIWPAETNISMMSQNSTVEWNLSQWSWMLIVPEICPLSRVMPDISRSHDTQSAEISAQLMLQLTMNFYLPTFRFILIHMTPLVFTKYHLIAEQRYAIWYSWNSSGRNQKVVEPVNQQEKDNVMKWPVKICPETHFLATRKGDIKIASVHCSFSSRCGGALLKAAFVTNTCG